LTIDRHPAPACRKKLASLLILAYGHNGLPRGVMNNRCKLVAALGAGGARRDGAYGLPDLVRLPGGDTYR
jgi:hypothetical protein